MGAEIQLNWEENLDYIVDEALSDGLNKQAIHFQAKVKDNFGRDGTGAKVNNVLGTQEYRYKKNAQGEWIRSKNKTRKRFKSERNVYQSAPEGGFPGIRTGKLRQSIAVVKATAANLAAVVGTNLDYARWLEYGWLNKARDGSVKHVAARPFMRRTLAEEKDKLTEVMSTSVKEYLNKRLGGKQ